jgi:hypothetical protein
LNSGDLGNSDIIDGAGGTDTLYAVQALSTVSSTIRPVLTSVETVQLQLDETASSETGAHTFTANFDKSSGINTVDVKNYTFNTAGTGAADTVAITGVTTATSLKITDEVGGSATARKNNFTVTYDGVSGSADVASASINSTVAAVTLGNITVAGVETLTVSSTGGANASYAVVAADATALTLNASAKSGGAVDLNAAKVVTLNINAADDLSVADGGGASAKLRTVNIDSQTADKTVTLTTLTPTPTAAATDAVVINVKGAGKATISIDTDFDTQSATNADTVTVNAATNTGGVSFTTSAKAANKVTGGTGNDSVTLGAALDKDDVIALGDGTADALVTTATYTTAAGTVADLYYSDSIATADLPVISGVEVARINIAGTAAANTISAKSATFASTVEFNAATAATTGADVDNNNLTISNLKAGQTVKFGSNLLIDDSTITLEVIDASTNTADVLQITTDGLNATATATFEGFTAANIETVSVDLASTNKDNTTITAGTLTFANATAVTLTGSKITTATVDAKDGATIDASAMTGTLDLTAATADKYTIKGSSTKATKFIMSTGLDKDDTIVGGAATTDSLTATVTSLTATTGVLKISGVETLGLTNTGTAVVDMTSVTGATNVALIGAGTSTTLSKLTSGTKVTLGDGAGNVTFTGDVTIALADATGSADSLTIDLNGGGARGTSVLTTAGIETIVLNGDTSTTAQVAYEAQTVTMTASDAKTISITGGHATPAKITLGTLNAATTTLDASTFTGGVIATAAANTAMTVKVRVSTDNDITLDTGNDNVTVGTAALMAGGAIAAAGEIDGGAGSDTLTVYAKNSADLGLADNFEVVNVIVDAAANATIDLGGTGQGADDAASITVTGGASGKTLALTEIVSDIGARTIDASAVASTTTLTLGDNVLVQAGLADAIVLKGGSAAADVLAYTASNDDSGEVTISGFETIKVTNGNTESTLNLKNVTGANNIEAIGDGQLIISNFSNAQKIVLGTWDGTTATAFSDGTGDTLTVSRAANGTADVLSLDLNTTAAFTVTDNQVETVNLTLVNTTNNDDHVVTLSSTSATTLNIVGAGADEDLTITAAGALLTTVNASALVGNLTYGVSNRAAQAMTITAGTGNDTVGMTFAADVLDGGTKASDNDTLEISFTGTGGALIVDLTSSTDQVQMFNGLANAAVQKNFESVSAAAYTQTNSIGADITGTTGANTVTGTAYADSIRTGAGADTIIVATATAGNSDVIDGGANTDTLVLAVGSHTFATNDNLVNVEEITLGNGTNTLTLTNQSEAFKITGGTGADTIVCGSGIDTIVAGTGADVITGAAGADVITLSTETTPAVDTVIYNATTEGGDTITGFITGSDKLKFKETGFGTTATWSTNAPITTNTATSTYFEVTTDAAAGAVDLNAAGTTTTGFVLVGATTGTAGVKIYYTADVGAFATGNSTLIATLAGISTGDVAATDFLGY